MRALAGQVFQEYYHTLLKIYENIHLSLSYAYNNESCCNININAWNRIVVNRPFSLPSLRNSVLLLTYPNHRCVMLYNVEEGR